MQKIIHFFVVYKNTLLTVFLFFLAGYFTIQSHSYHTDKVVHSAHRLSGTLYQIQTDISSYFKLREQNQKLTEENVFLKNTLFNSLGAAIQLDTLQVESSHYIVRSATIINNSYMRSNNHLTLQIGSADGVTTQMGVVAADGVIGIIDQVGTHYSTAMSVLHSKSSISVMLKKSGHFGSLIWDGKSPYQMQFVDVARMAPVQIGDTVVTDGRSTIFPKNIPIGTVSSFELDRSENFFIIQVDLFHDMTRSGQVYVIENVMAEQIKELESTTTDE
jgi:rod shape-determining protein MreC